MTKLFLSNRTSGKNDIIISLKYIDQVETNIFSEIEQVEKFFL